MAVVEAESEGLDELVIQLLERYDAPPVIKRPGQPGRPCRCDLPIGIADDLYPSWVRCLLCGRDVRDARP